MKKSLLLITTIIISALLFGCSSTKITQQYKNPDTGYFQANKVLVIGISSDNELRRAFESKMVSSLEKKDVIAVKSIDFFEKSFSDNKQSIRQLNQIENKLLESGFDAILFSKITGKESRVTLVDAYQNFSKQNQTFEDYYFRNQNEYFKEQEERYQIYTTETSLFCICPGKERELLWRGEIELVDAAKTNQNINSYINVLFKALKENNLLLLNE
ncbi:hypothetical protein [Patiriisocius marinus]|uniref:Cardiolipin synthetase n=1 Tax=Patiriisocius marinus TaxID=1397112 RepID=A0A5J4IYP5_9FLAO|nr:hypothetical protein [Patiriisocius marinus]GER60056.1 hypothetical protein ULMA_21640 [Patiriisocius marinus]